VDLIEYAITGGAVCCKGARRWQEGGRRRGRERWGEDPEEVQGIAQAGDGSVHIASRGKKTNSLVRPFIYVHLISQRNESAFTYLHTR
jgi:hypothetical protein